MRISREGMAHGIRAPWTADRDFSRFPSLATSNPLAGVLRPARKASC